MSLQDDKMVAARSLLWSLPLYTEVACGAVMVRRSTAAYDITAPENMARENLDMEETARIVAGIETEEERSSRMTDVSNKHAKDLMREIREDPEHVTTEEVAETIRLAIEEFVGETRQPGPSIEEMLKPYVGKT